MENTKNRRRGAPGPVVAEWNEANPVGTPVHYFPVLGRPDKKESKTRSEAWVLGGHTAVVNVEGISGCVAISNLETIDE